MDRALAQDPCPGCCQARGGRGPGGRLRQQSGWRGELDSRNVLKGAQENVLTTWMDGHHGKQQEASPEAWPDLRHLKLPSTDEAEGGPARAGWRGGIGTWIWI